MARWTLEAGERVIEKLRVSTIAENRRRPAELILTDRRVALVSDLTQLGSAFGVLGFLLSRLSPRSAVVQQIRREEFADAEIIDMRQLKLRSRGEGYGMIWFAFETKTPQVWADRLHQWRHGAPAAQPLPTAKLVER